jgi:hypothetical protein
MAPSPRAGTQAMESQYPPRACVSGSCGSHPVINEIQGLPRAGCAAVRTSGARDTRLSKKTEGCNNRAGADALPPSNPAVFPPDTGFEGQFSHYSRVALNNIVKRLIFSRLRSGLRSMERVLYGCGDTLRAGLAEPYGRFPYLHRATSVAHARQTVVAGLATVRKSAFRRTQLATLTK